MTATPPAAAGLRRFLPNTQSDAWGYFCGCVLALGASLSFATARAGVLSGLSPGDMILMRFGVSGLFLLPFWVASALPALAGVGWRRAVLLTALAGPGFALMQMGGYAFAPLAHGAVIHPAAVTIISTVIAAVLLKEQLSGAHLIGAALVIGGIILISWQGLHAATGANSWIGDLLFLTSAMIWACFTVLIRHWRLHAIRAIAVVSFLSLILMLPGYFAWYGMGHLRTLPPGAMAMQGLVQGFGQGVSRSPLIVRRYAYWVSAGRCYFPRWCQRCRS